MSGNISNIDDLLITGQGNSQQPPTPEHIDEQEERQEINEENVESSDDYGIDASPIIPKTHEPEENHEKIEEKSSKEIDEYGNETESMTEVMKSRLKKQAEKYESRIQALESQISQLTPLQHQQLQQEAKNFQADPNSDEDWQRQFESMVEQTVNNMHAKKQQEVQRNEEMRLDQDFQRKLLSGMDRFSDFREAIRDVGCDITNYMTNATRSLEDPAAFLYAAAKRHPDELQRISKLSDPYAQIREMGKLEEKMRKNKPISSAPRPLDKLKADAIIAQPKAKENKELNGDELIARNDAKRLANARSKFKR
jgi:hypothetical protein